MQSLADVLWAEVVGRIFIIYLETAHDGVVIMKRHKFSNEFIKVSILLLVAVGLAGCASSSTEQTTPLADIFSASLNPNVARICGPAISSTFDYDGVTYQYTFNCAFSYDARRSQPVHIEPVGNPFAVDIAATEQQPKPGQTMIDGYIVWSEVEAFLKDNQLQDYDLLQLLGRPKTPMVYNRDKHRYEQYFVNMGFYRYENDPVGMIHLIPYGVIYCGSDCIFDNTQVEDQSDLNGAPSSEPLQTATDNAANKVSETSVFASMEKRYKSILGAALGQEETSKDGILFKPYTNLWLCSYPSDPKKVRPCPLAEWAATPRSAPVLDSGTPGMWFWEVENGLGFNIPEIVMDSVSINGTRELSGNPLFEPKPLAGSDNAWVCFQNYCMVYNRITLDPTTVSFYPLGQYYYEIYMNEPQAAPTVEAPLVTTPEAQDDYPIGEPIRSEVWDRFPFLQPTQQQVIGIVLHQGEQVLEGVSLRLIVTLPGDVKQTWEMRPTDANGRSIYAMPLVQAPNGSRIIYEVCTYGLKPMDLCDQDSFTVQQSP